MVLEESSNVFGKQVATASMWPPHQATNAKYCKLLNHKQLYLV